MPNFVSYSGQIVDLYPTQGFDTAIEITYTAMPIGDIGDIELCLPMEAQDAIIAGTLAEILSIPGQHQNLQLAEMRRLDYERMKGNLRAIGVLGMGGNAQFQAPVFVGSFIWPWNQTSWVMPGPGGWR
jgi:hypothetical protein